MAKKKAATKKTSASNKPAKKAAPAAKKSNAAKPTGAAKSKPAPTKASVKTAVKVVAKPAAYTNGTAKTTAKKLAQAKPESKKIAGSNPAPFKAKQNGSADDKGLNPQTYQMLRQDIISTLWKYDEITFDELCAAMGKIHGKNFVNDSLKYLEQVMTDLMNIELIEKVDQGANRQAYRIRQRLGD
ncbi:MAG TPA: hypothetical protein VEY71_12130 [Chitinophagales bacterium]|nr:hypothetical protein [Chitinophagales bacterium]